MIEPSQVQMLRKALNLTQKELAKQVKMSQSYITKIENNLIDPSYLSMEKISNFFKSKEVNSSLKIKDIYHKQILFIDISQSIKDAALLFDSENISQAPVRDKNDNLIGILTEKGLLLGLKNNYFLKDCIDPLPPILDENISVEVAKTLLLTFPIILVQKSGKIKGVLTRIDILKNL